ncbi:uncharacterized protein LOC112046496 [Bicyclus anynana]|uniref:Uncharacterized protein LOC112046496 n=1 Tax=Bicyclus anynana TaxID=110368 RepID=A0A6J1MTD2_BICAN|nr:uncharacterized protein LOC112046496 [Bicyclus anynana]XP_052740271.1 uncharacterized protein LOC112046496 [Bicyclus anynana]
MRIPGLTPFLLRDLKTSKLKDTTVVIDGENILTNVSKVPHFGCESDKIANSVKNHLIKFKKAKLDCYFVFKREIDDDKKSLDRSRADARLRKALTGEIYKKDEDTHVRICTKDIWFQTVEEMGFKYTVSDGDHVTECIALAVKLSCPLIGNNMQYFFSQAEYVPELKTKLDKNDNLLCQIYTLSSFLEKYNMTEEKVILFIMLSDLHIYKENHFKKFFEHNNILCPSGRSTSTFLEKLIKFVAQNSNEDIINRLSHVIEFFVPLDFLYKKNRLETLIQNRKNTDTKMTLYVTDKTKCQFTVMDPDWFEKGLFCKYIPMPYINMYKSETVQVREKISIPIVQYAFDLLTNFKHKMNAQKRNLNPCSSKDILECESSIPKPEYKATLSVFENGWDDIKQLNLFEHFVTETLQTFDFERLGRVPADCRLLLVALVYYSRKKSDVTLEIYSILLSYVMLSVVTEKLSKDGSRSKNTKNVSEQLFIDSLTDRDLVTAADCDIAWSIMKEYFNFSNEELSHILNWNALQPFTEFQCCLKELNNLNQLCGSQFDRTVYSRTYNSTIVYKIFNAMKKSGCQDGFQFIQNKLRPAPTVLAYLSGILGIYESIYHDYN